MNRKILALGVSLATLATAMPAAAQEAEQEQAETIVVTGSYIRRPENEAVPVTIIGPEEISQSSANSVVDLLDRLTATSGNLVTQNSDDQGNQVAAGISLRNLGPDATLVLLNGVRQPSLRTATDVNGLVPQVMLNRVEVLKDGASAAYGSEAIAGVVNFITDDRFDGVRFDAAINQVEAANKPGGNVGIMFGAQGDRTGIVAAVEYNKRVQLFTADRFDAERREIYGQKSIFGNPGSYIAGGPPTPDPLCGSPELGGVPDAGIPAGPFCRLDLTQRRGMSADQERVVGYVTMNHEFSDRLTASLESGFSWVDQARSDGNRFPLTNNRPLPVVPASNPFNPLGVDATLFHRISSNVEGARYENISRASETTFRLSGDVSYDLTDTWNFTASASYAQSDATTHSVDTDYANFTEALQCAGGIDSFPCYNPFGTALLASPGDPEYNEAELIDYLTYNIQSTGGSELWTAQALMSGEIASPFGADPIGVAFGYQHREESTFADIDEAAEAGELYFLPPSSDSSASRAVDAAFFEIFVPFSSALELNLAGRYDSYNTGESTFTPKASALFRATDTLTLRGAIGTSFRVAAIDQLIGSVGLASTYDPITDATFNGVGVTITPNPDLDPESGLNWSLGATWRPVEQLRLSIDHYSIELEDRIFTETLPGLVAENPNSDRILRDGDNNIVGAMLMTQNGGALRTNGIDFNASFKQPTGFGSLSAMLDLTHVYKFEAEDTEGNVTEAEGWYNRLISGIAPLPKTRANFTFGGETDSGFGLFATLRYTSKVKQDDATLAEVTEEKSWLTADLQANYAISDATSVTLSVDNVFDSDPPAVGDSIYTADALLYDLRGRTWTLGLRTEF